MLANSSNGLYNFRFELIEKLLSDGHDVYLALPYGAKISYFKEIGCNFIDIEFCSHSTNLFTEIQLIYKYFQVLKQVKPDIIFSYTIKPNIYGSIASKRYKIPIITNITGLGVSFQKNNVFKKVVISLYKYAFKDIRKVYFQNEDNLIVFKNNKIIKSNYGLIPGSGVNLDKFYPTKYPQSKNLEFAFISRIMKEKGIDLYLQVAKYYYQKHSNFVFHVCGRCEKGYEEIIKEYNEKEIIIYHGSLNDVRPIYKQINCLIHPTNYPEGISNVILEACACARPVITNNITGCKDIIDDEKNGYLMKQYTLKNLIYLMEKFIRNTKKEEMGIYGRHIVEKKFNRQIVVNEYLNQLYK